MNRVAVAAVLAITLLADAGYPLAAQDAPKAKRTDSEPVVCKAKAETGSMVRRRKQCFTKSEWDRIAAAAREGATDMMDKNANRSSGQ